MGKIFYHPVGQHEAEQIIAEAYKVDSSKVRLDRTNPFYIQYIVELEFPDENSQQKQTV